MLRDGIELEKAGVAIRAFAAPVEGNSREKAAGGCLDVLPGTPRELLSCFLSYWCSSTTALDESFESEEIFLDDFKQLVEIAVVERHFGDPP